MIDTLIAAKLGISKSAYYRYQSKYPEFAEAIRRGKSKTDHQVQSSLLKRAVGFFYVETVETTLKNGNVKTTEILKYKPPDIKAIIHWLKRRRPDLWK